MLVIARLVGYDDHVVHEELATFDVTISVAQPLPAHNTDGQVLDDAYDVVWHTWIYSPAETELLDMAREDAAGMVPVCVYHRSDDVRVWRDRGPWDLLP